MKPCLRLACAACAVAILAPWVAAHPGHGEPTIMHYVDEPVHQVQVAAMVVAIIVASAWLAAHWFGKQRAGE